MLLQILYVFVYMYIYLKWILMTNCNKECVKVGCF